MHDRPCRATGLLVSYRHTEPRRCLVFVVCVLATMVGALEATIVVTAAPMISAELGGFGALGWMFSAYLLAQAVAAPIYGRLADLHGRRPVFLVSVALLMLGCLLAGFAASMPVLIAARFVQGAGAGGTLVVYTMLGDVYSPVERIRLQSWTSAVWAVSAVIGPALGIYVAIHFDWRGVFWVPIPILLLIGLLAIRLPKEIRDGRRTMDLPGAALFVLWAGLLVCLLLSLDALGRFSIPVLGVTVVLILLFGIRERRADEPLLSPILWTERIVLTANAGGFAIGATTMAVSAFLPTYAQAVMGLNSVQIVIMVSLNCLAWPIGSILAAPLMISTSYRSAAITGAALLLCGCVVLAGADTVTALWVANFLIGLAMGLCSAAFTISAQAFAQRENRGMITASTVFSRLMGASVGVALFTSVFSLALTRQLPGLADPLGLLLRADHRVNTDIARIAAGVTEATDQVFIAAIVMATLALAAAYLMPRRVRPHHQITQGG